MQPFTNIDLGGPAWAYYAVMAACWGVGWGLLGVGYRAPAVIGGVVGGSYRYPPGSLPFIEQSDPSADLEGATSPSG